MTAATDPAPTPSDWTPESAKEELDRLREQISEVDERLIRTIGERRDLVLQVGRIKEILGIPVLDPGREAQVVRGAVERAREFGLDEEMTRDVFWRIIAAARSAQSGR
ncbi:MAG: chorismate mutase [Gemmatimonadota bacterium]